MTAHLLADDTLTAQELAVGWLDDLLGRDGLAVEQGYHYNEGQHDYAHRALAGFFAYDPAQRQTALNALEAATGTGKTLGYFSAAACYSAATGERVAISTHSRQLQRQMAEKDAPNILAWVERLSGVTLHAARRIGKRNYVDRGRVDALLHAIEQDAGTAGNDVTAFLKALRKWLGDSASTGVLDDYLQEFGVELPVGVSPAAIGMSAQTSEIDAQAYERDLAGSKQADILITNHALLVLHAYRWGRVLDEEGGRETRVVIVDEAHRLPGVAETILSDAFSIKRSFGLAKHLAKSLVGLDEKAKRHWQAFSKHLETLDNFLVENRPAQVGAFAPVAGISGLGELVHKAADGARRAGEAIVPLTYSLASDPKRDDLHLNDALDMCVDVQRIAAGMADNSQVALASWSPIKSFPSLSVGVPDAGRLMSRLWAVPNSRADMDDGPDEEALLPPRPRLNALLLTSATLGSPDGSMVRACDPLFNALGIIRHVSRKTGQRVHFVMENLMKRYEPTRFGEMTFVLPDPRVPAPTVRYKAGDTNGDEETTLNQKWVRYAAQMVRAAYASQGRVLVLANSWRETKAVAAALAEMDGQLPLQVHRQGQPLRPLLKTYATADKAILLSPAAWDGVDLPGLVPALVVLRLPYRPPHRVDTLRTRVSLRAQGVGDDKIRVILFVHDQRAAWEKLRQGLGRGVRRPSDACEVWVADPRFPVPDHWIGSFDPLLAKMPPASQKGTHRGLLNAIPKRFLGAHSEAQVFNLDTQMRYKPEVW